MFIFQIYFHSTKTHLFSRNQIDVDKHHTKFGFNCTNKRKKCYILLIKILQKNQGEK